MRAAGPTRLIMVSGGLDEFDIERLLDADAPINTFGVGTRIGVSADAPSLETVYKLVEYAGQPRMKLSEGKQSKPGVKQVYRSHTGDSDLLAERSEPAPPGTSPLLIEVMRDVAPVSTPEPIKVAADRLTADPSRLPASALVLRRPTVPEVGVSQQLQDLTRRVADAHSGKLLPGA